MDDPKSTVAFLWILGEYGEIIDAAPYILETFIDSFTSYHHTIRLEILSSTMKLFFKRPPEIQKMLGRLFATAIQDDSHADVHDRALFYYRLLSTNVNAVFFQNLNIYLQNLGKESCLWEKGNYKELYRRGISRI